MIALAPGKVVISGAYAVLYGAPAVVSAVDRYVRADSKAKSDFVTPEVRAAMNDGEAPCFDAAALRQDGRKLGLGSSAAILVASLAARHPDWLANDLGRKKLFARAMAAHREAQGGGSGVDVLASVYGGTRCARLSTPDGTSEPTLEHRTVVLPPELHFAIWVAPGASSTSEYIRRVSELAQENPTAHSELVAELSQAAELAVEALDTRDAETFLTALRSQLSLLHDLGRLAGIPIVTDAVSALATRAAASQAVVIPAGAGGGDIALYIGFTKPNPALLNLARDLGHNPLDAALQANGVHLENS